MKDYHLVRCFWVNANQITVKTGSIAGKNWNNPHQRWVRFAVNTKHSSAMETQRLILRMNQDALGTDPEDYLNLRTKIRPEKKIDPKSALDEKDKPGQKASNVQVVQVALPGSGGQENFVGNKDEKKQVTARDINAPLYQVDAENIEGSFNIENSFNRTAEVLKKKGQNELADAITQLNAQMIELKNSADAGIARKIDKHSASLLDEAIASERDESILHFSANGLISAAKL